MKVIDNKKYFELAELKKMLKQKSWKDSWNVETIYVNGFIEFLEKIEIIEENKPIEKIRQFCEYPCSDKYECWSIKEDILVNKINEIIDKLNELKKESDK